MARGGSSFGSKLLILLLLILVGYCMWQIASLKREVAQLRVQVAQCKAQLRGPVRGMGARSLIEDALSHADQAKRYLMSGNPKRARAEWDESQRLMERAGRNVTDPSVSAFQNVQRKLDDLQKMWKDFMSDEPDRTRGG